MGTRVVRDAARLGTKCGGLRLLFRYAGHHRRISPEKGDLMGREARIGLLLGAAACLLAIMVDYVVEELR